MNHFIKVIFLSASLSMIGASGRSPAQQCADNSKQNKGQLHDQTADKQPNAKGDRMTAARVRKAIIADKGLSMYAHNVKVIVRGGQLTLKGPVRTEEEKQRVAADAATAVSANSISNQLTVK